MRNSRLTVLLLTSCAAFSDGAVVQERCLPLKQAERTRLETYIRKEFKVPAGTPIKIAEAQDGVCASFRKLEVASTDPARKFQLTVYASPDLRFLTRDLLDTRIDPEVEERRRQREFRAGLTNGDFPALGPANAPVTLTVFSDFQCPYCARLAGMLSKDVLPADGANVRVVFRQFPLQMHSWARQAAQAAVCAAQQNHHLFWKLHDFIFENQSDFTPKNVIDKIAAQAWRFPKFDRARFSACVNDPATAAKIDRDIALGTQNGVSGTPTVFMNGQRISVTAPEQLRTLIREVKAAPKAAAPAR